MAIVGGAGRDSRRARGALRVGMADSMEKTAVIALAVGYPWQRYAAFVAPLRAHYKGDILLIGQKSSMTAEAQQVCSRHRAKIIPFQHRCLDEPKTCKHSWQGIERFPIVAGLCRERGYAYCLSTDFRDVIFQGDPFAGLPRLANGAYNDLTLTCEASEVPYGKSFFNSAWFKTCVGVGQLYESVRRSCVVNSGAIFGSPAGFDYLAAALTSSCPTNVTGTKHDLHGVDQTLLGWHYYSGRYKSGEGPSVITATLQKRGFGSVNTLRYAHTYLPRVVKHVPENRPETLRWPYEWPFRVINDDGSLSAAVHQYDVNLTLRDMVEETAQREGAFLHSSHAEDL